MIRSQRSVAAILDVLRRPETARGIIERETVHLQGPLRDVYQLMLMTASIQLELDTNHCDRLWLTGYVLRPEDPGSVRRRLRILATAFQMVAQASGHSGLGADLIGQLVTVAEREYVRPFPDAHLPFQHSVNELFVSNMSLKKLETDYYRDA